MSNAHSSVLSVCYHCGEKCEENAIIANDKNFCCVGCSNVYTLLHEHDMEFYYCLNEKPGRSLKEVNMRKFNFLDDPEITSSFIQFSNKNIINTVLYIPNIHCSSCLWLLENLHSIHPGVISSQVNFKTKQISISFYKNQISFKQVAELLTSCGYEPHFSHDKNSPSNNIDYDRSNAIRLGIAGFCFANIMLISFPEYLGLTKENDALLTFFFRYINLALSIPVIAYSAQEFFINAYHSIKQRYLNIDTPIALAIILTFVRSLYEIFSGSGPGYLDSMSGIVFFMLIGRTLQNKIIKHLNFNRDYKSYFPIAVTIVREDRTINIPIEKIQKDDVLKLFHGEIIPVDCILSKGIASIDYSFVTGESIPEQAAIGEIIYAGGRVAGNSIETIVIKPFSQNSFTKLWNNPVFNNKKNPASYIDFINKYFSIAVLSLGIISFFYWQFVYPPNAWKAISTILIVACPCALLLASSYANGFIIELFSLNGFYVKNASVVEQLTKINHIVFDKTGTLTENGHLNVKYHGNPLNKATQEIVLSIMSQSMHPLSKAIVAAHRFDEPVYIPHIKEIPGKGLEAWVNELHFKIGSAEFVYNTKEQKNNSTEVYISIENNIVGKYTIGNKFRSRIKTLISALEGFKLSLLSGDNQNAAQEAKKLFPVSANLLFEQSPEMKLNYIKSLQEKGNKVLMMGDGLNDAGALKQSDVGIAVVENNFNFSPACDVVCHASKVSELFQYIQAAKIVKRVIIGTFIYSILYNVIGLYYAMSAKLEPVIAAILMPASSLSIILISFLSVWYIKKKYFSNNALVTH